MKRVVIIGAGPAGITAGLELKRKAADEYAVTILEKENRIGGISATVEHNGNRMDMGGHRFFSKIPQVNDWWESILPTQGELPYDDRLLGRVSTVKSGGPDPETTDTVMLKRNRLSRIYFKKKFFDYPISLKFSTIRNMGFGTTVAVCLSYLKSLVHKREENSLEDFYINRFGKKLYSMFFENYTENLWGRHPSEISPEWGAQRVKGLSVTAVLRDIFSKVFHRKNRTVETSLIEEFSYPKFGPGQLWEAAASEFEALGGKIIKNAEVTNAVTDGGTIINVVYEKDGKSETVGCDILISSMPVKDLVAGINGVPDEISRIANGLPYRDYITLGVLLPRLNLKNETDIKTVNNIIPDNWIYVHDRRVKMGRFQIYNNWSPYMIKNIENTVWLGLEYFCNEGDAMWSLSNEEFAKTAIGEMVTIGLISNESDVLDFHVERVKKAYPAYFDTYEEMDSLRAYLDSIGNLYCVGRNGQHRYNNMDHSMCTSFEAVKNILTGRTDKDNIWNVNTEKEYHEEKSS